MFEEEIEYEILEEEPEQKRKKHKKAFKKIIEIKSVDNNFLNELKKEDVLNKYGVCDILIKDSTLKRERFIGAYWDAVERAIQVKREHPNCKVKIVIKK